MVLENCRISLTNITKPIYHGGDIVKGAVDITIDKQKKLTDLMIEFKGETLCKWHENIGIKKKNTSIAYFSSEEHFRMALLLTSGFIRNNSGRIVLEPGNYKFPFSFSIPLNSPTSFESNHGSIRHTIKVTAIKNNKNDEFCEIPISVISKYDLNANPICAVPVRKEINKDFSFLFTSKGAMTMVLTLPVTGFIPGQTLKMKCTINNYSAVTILGITFTLMQHVTFKVTNPKNTKKEIWNKLVKYEGKGAEKGEEKTYPVSITIPTLSPTSIYQGLITSVYYLKVKAVASGIHHNPSDLIPIIIGTIPLRNAESLNDRFIDVSVPSSSATAPLFMDSSPVTENTNMERSLSLLRIAPPSYEESQKAYTMSKATTTPRRRDDDLHYGPIFPVYEDPPRRTMEQI